MTAPLTIRIAERAVPTPRGRLHAVEWSPADAAAPARTPLVLLHDSLGCVALWRDFPDALARATGRRVIAYDRLGFGRSDPHPGALPASFIHDEAREGFRHLRAAFALDRFIAFGHSVGGGMAVGCAAVHPEACEGLVAMSAQAFVEDRTRQGIRAAREAFARPGQVERLAKYHGDKARWVLGAWIDTWLAPGFAGWTLDDDLRRVRCPSLVLHGDCDEYGSALHPRRIAARVAGPASLHLLEGCGHVPQREQPDAVLSKVRHWLAATAAEDAGR